MYFMQIVDLITNDDSIPMSIKLDVSKKIIDYCEAGGKETDQYIKKELDFLLEVKANAKQNK